MIRPRITIIEGTDGVGKTTYAKDLARTTGATYRHAGAPQQTTVVEEYLEPLSVHLDQPFPPGLVLDRWHIGEMVWPDIFGRPSLFGDKDGDRGRQFHHLNREMALLGVVRVILVVRDEAGIRSTLRGRGEPEEDVANSVKAQTLLFKHSMRVVGIPVKVIHSDKLPTAPVNQPTLWGDR